MRPSRYSAPSVRKGAADLAPPGGNYKLYLLWGRSSRWHQLKSTWFEMSSWDNRYEFRGRGLGHGIGLCQWGTYGRAIAGETYRTILASYFSGTEIGISR